MRAAFADVAGAEVDDRELRRGGVSYAIDTVRAVAAEHPGLAGRFGEPNLEKAGFALELNLDGYGQFKSGTTYRLEICLRDNTGRAEDDLRIGVYEITIQDGAAGAGVSAEEIAAGWDNRTGE